jgi:DNA-binding transcriptional LysR family regulator
MNKATIKQWQMFHAVVKYGGFAQASAKVFKSASSIHHSVNKLENMLNVSLLRLEGRKMLLTSHGKEIFCLVEKLLSDACNLEAYVSGLTNLDDSSIRIAIDELFPMGILRCVLQSSSCDFSLKQLEIAQVSATSFDDNTHSDVILSVLKSSVSGFSVKSVFSVHYVAVSGTKNSAFDSLNVMSANELNKHIEIRVDRETVNSTMNDANNHNCWMVDKLSSAIDLVCEGIGYAWLPYIDVQHCIEEGKLRKLTFNDQPNIREIDFYLNVRQDFSSKPGVENIVNHFKNFDSSNKFLPVALLK